MSKRRGKPDPFSAHEALDRSHLAVSFFSDFVVEHPYVRSHPALVREADELAERSGAFYQLVGRLRFDVDEPRAKRIDRKRRR